MRAKQQLKSIILSHEELENGEVDYFELMDGMSDDEIENFKNQLPNRILPDEIEELLRFSRGFGFYGFEEVRFDAFGYFGLENIFPNSIQLAGDGFGNFWVLDIDLSGGWNSVYYVCHDPPVVIKQAENLSQFIKQIDEYEKKGNESTIDIVHEKITMDIWTAKDVVKVKNQIKYNFENSDFNLTEPYFIADLSNTRVMTGFSWGTYGKNTTIIRPSDKPIWIVKKKRRQSFLSKLFGVKK